MTILREVFVLGIGIGVGIALTFLVAGLAAEYWHRQARRAVKPADAPYTLVLTSSGEVLRVEGGGGV